MAEVNEKHDRYINRYDILIVFGSCLIARKTNAILLLGNKCKYASYLITPDGERVASDSWKGGKLMCVPLYAGQEKEDYENFADEVIIPARPEPKCIPDAAKFKYC